MSTSTKRRHDDYRPATLRNFWRSCQNVIWTIERSAARWFQIAEAVLLITIVAAAVALGAFAFVVLKWG